MARLAPDIAVQADHVVLNGRPVPLRLRRGRRGGIRLGIAEDHVWLETGSGTLDPHAADFVRSKAGWLSRALQRMAQGNQARQALQAALTKQAPLFGGTVPIRFEPGPKLWYRYDGRLLTIFLTERQRSRAATCVRPVLQQIAKQYLVRRTQQLAAHVGLHVNQVRVKNHRSKWGSCSSLGNINLNWHLVLLDKALSDYVIVHELMHLHEMNHGPRFWSLVGQYVPNYKSCVTQIRAQEWILGCYD